MYFCCLKDSQVEFWIFRKNVLIIDINVLINVFAIFHYLYFYILPFIDGWNFGFLGSMV